MTKLSIDDLRDEEVRGRRVLVRVDYNVPLDERLDVTDDTRIRATLPTLERLAGLGARLVLLSHLGRPKGKRVPEMSVRPAAERLATLTDHPVHFLGVTSGEEALAATEELAPGEILLLENTRFDPREEANDPTLAEDLARLAELFVNDAFGAAHRAHASTVGVVERVKERGGLAVAGLLLKRELEYLGSALDAPRHPFVAVLGGAKISGKIDVIQALLPRVDHLLIGGAMANTFFRALGLSTGRSLVEEDRIPLARDLLDGSGDKLVLPVDVVVAREPREGTEVRTVPRDEIPDGWMALDIGERSVESFRDTLLESATVLWNGPMGVAEVPEFRAGTEGVSRALVEATGRGATTVVGGGDSAAALAELGLQDGVSHVSTGGGASLEFLEGKPLPGVAALSDRNGSTR
jgi:phosphoglycerate kinase